MKLKSITFSKEQSEIQTKVARLLGIPEENTFLLSDLDKNIQLQESLINLSSDIRKYYACNNFKAVTDPKRIKRPWLSIIKLILNSVYDIITNDYHFTEDGKYIHTKKYIFRLKNKNKDDIIDE